MKPLSDKTIVRISAASIAVAVVIGFFFFPPVSDDIGYMMPFKNFFNGDTTDYLSTVWSSISYRYLNDNGRFANIVMILSAVWPRWIIQALSGIAIYAILVIAAKIAAIDRRPLPFLLWGALFLALFPWIDQIYLSDFQLNYIWSCALSFLILYLFLKNRPRFSIFLFICCLLIGFWHELFAGALIAAFASLILFYPPFRNKPNIIYTFSLFPGIIYLMMPRIGDTVWQYFATRMSIIYFFALPLILLIVIWSIALFRSPRARSRALSPAFISLSVVAVASTALMVISSLGPRTGAFGIASALVAFCGLIPSLAIPLSRSLKYLISATLILFISCHLIAVDIQCYKAGKSYNQAIEKYLANPYPTHFVDFTLRSDVPLICIQKPYFDWFGHRDTMRPLHLFYGICHEYIKIAPATLEDIDTALVNPIPGSARIAEYKGLLIGPKISDDPASTSLLIRINNRDITRKFYVVPLAPDSPFAWYYLEHSTLKMLFNENITKIDTEI